MLWKRKVWYVSSSPSGNRTHILTLKELRPEPFRRWSHISFTFYKYYNKNFLKMQINCGLAPCPKRFYDLTVLTSTFCPSGATCFAVASRGHGTRTHTLKASEPKSEASTNSANPPYKIDACHSFSLARVSIIPYLIHWRCSKSFTYITFKDTYSLLGDKCIPNPFPSHPKGWKRLCSQQLRFTLAEGKSTS